MNLNKIPTYEDKQYRIRKLEENYPELIRAQKISILLAQIYAGGGTRKVYEDYFKELEALLNEEYNEQIDEFAQLFEARKNHE